MISRGTQKKRGALEPAPNVIKPVVGDGDNAMLRLAELDRPSYAHVAAEAVRGWSETHRRIPEGVRRVGQVRMGVAREDRLERRVGLVCCSVRT